MTHKKVFLCDLSYIPLRRSPADSAELTTMMLFGESFIVLETQKNWHYIKMLYDDYDGWIFRRKLTEFPEKEQVAKSWKVLSDPWATIKSDHGKQFFLGVGSELPEDSSVLKLRNEKWTLPNTKSSIFASKSAGNILKIARSLLDTPYLWGGRSVFGIDCSGFVQIVFKVAGISLLRDASQQIEQGRAVTFDEKKSGDLAFFQNENGKIVHVGILAENSRIIHASEFVREDGFSEEGIKRSGKITHSLAAIRRYI